MFLTLDKIKHHLNIDPYFTEDDAYLLSLGEVAEQTVQRHVCCVLEDMADESGVLPAPLLQAMLLYVGVLYNSRESVTYGGNPANVPFTFEYLLNLYKNYADTTSDAFVASQLDELAAASLLSDTPEEEEIAPMGDVAITTKDKAIKRLAANTSIDEDGNYVVRIKRI